MYLFRIPIILLFFIIPCNVPAGGFEALPLDLRPGLEYLEDIAASNDKVLFDPQKLEPILEFVCMEKTSRHFSPPRMNGRNGAYYEYFIRSSLSRILQYAYNPDIPSWTVMPSAVRFSKWTEVTGERGALSKLWMRLHDLKQPILVRGKESEVITPDENRCGYYAYDLRRTMVLFRRGNQRVIISLSQQIEKSEVAKKGVIVGPDQNWKYFYSGITGLTPFGLGWVDSYIYDSFSISIYVESTHSDHVKNALFKWMGAGWIGLDMVKDKHLHSGLIRYSGSFKEILESRNLPDPQSLERIFTKLNRLSENELRQKMMPLLDTFRKRAKEDSVLSRKEFLELLDTGRYLSQMTKEEMVADLMVEYIRNKLGRNDSLEIDRLMKNLPPGQTSFDSSSGPSPAASTSQFVI